MTVAANDHQHPDLLVNVPEVLHSRVVHHWQDWNSACENIDVETDAKVDHALLGTIWACSEFVATTMCRHAHIWFELIDRQDLDRSFSLDDYRQQLNQSLQSLSGNDDASVMKALRLFRQKQMLRIAWRDLSGAAKTTETLKNLTDLAEACVDLSLEFLYQQLCQQLGTPKDSLGNEQRLVVIGMGKLGGYELNYSSDIDLIFGFSEEGETNAQRPIASSQFFTRLGQRLIKVLNDVTADGFVFRVDMRLRPYGDSGPLVMSQAAMEQYYQTQGRDWERYAMIKARIIGGDRAYGKDLMEMLQPFIYRRYLDFGAFASIRDMKSLIDREIKRKGNQHNIKLGSGGIREIEFIGQTFQLIRGGGEPELQIRGILDVLSLLAEKNYLTVAETEQLTLSYDFLRRLENRLQMYNDAQTHLLPDNEQQQTSMALAMQMPSWQNLYQACDEHRHAVHEIFVQLLHETVSSDDAEMEESWLQEFWQHDLDEVQAIQQLKDAGMDEVYVQDFYQQFQLFRNASQLKSVTVNGRQRLDTLMPAVLELLIQQSQPVEVLNRVTKLLQAILKRSVYLSLLNEYPSALKQLVKLFAASPWITHLLSRYPVLLDELLDSRSLYQITTPEQLTQELELSLQQAGDDEEQQIERLRKFKQAQVLKIAAMDIADVLDVFEVSQQLTHIAEVLLAKVKQLAWDWMLAKHGRPVCEIDGEEYFPQIAIIAYGKMGGEELGYGSDLDLVFLHDSHGEKQQTEGKRVLDNSSFFARLAQRIIHLLSVQTANGRLYEIDMRLRPDGNAGMLVSSVQAYDRYQSEKAWTWEHQALIRARIIGANTHLKSEFDRIRKLILMRVRDKDQLAVDIVEMREKMRSNLGSKPGSEKFHLKQDSGGLVDIEFLAQFGVLNGAAKYPALVENTATRKILMQMSEYKVINRSQADVLYQAYKVYRGLSHQRALQEQSSLVDTHVITEHRNNINEIWQSVLQPQVATK